VEWFKVWHTEILRGSLVAEDDSTQLIWLKLNALVSDSKLRNGRLEYGKGKPMSYDFIIESINTTPEKFNKAIVILSTEEEYDGISRITIEDNGTIVLNKWEYEQRNNVKKPKRKPMSHDQKQGMTRSLVNQNPDTARDTLSRDWGDNIVTKENKVY
jgi:hypothetical protein